MNADQIAMIAHEANRAYCANLGDMSQVPWIVAPQWQKDSALKGVTAILANPCMTPAGSHEGWLKHKTEEGWTYGEVKDEFKKTHPCMKPYNELPQEQRLKDHLFRAVVVTLMDVE